MAKIIVTGIGTDVGKTVVSAIITTVLKGDYWKPIQSGTSENSDISTIKNLIDLNQHSIHEPVYSFKAPLSPHHAAKLENIVIDLQAIIPPQTSRPLIIETAGGLLVPLTNQVTSLDLFKNWDCQWIIVSRHYLGSINHTLLTIEVLKKHKISIAGLVFNGEQNSDSEEAILNITKLPLIGRLFPERNINFNIIQRYSQKWQSTVVKHLAL